MSTVTFLDFINACLKRVQVIQGDAGELATSTVTSTATGLIATGAFEDSARQTQIDVMIQVANEAMHEVFSLGLFSQELSTATITLVTAQREYSLPANFERIAGRTEEERVMRAATYQRTVGKYPGGYLKMLADQAGLASTWQGQPNAYAISPNDGALRLDREPTTTENGQVWYLPYDKRIARTTSMATETLPFSDTVADSLVAVCAEGWSRVFKKDFEPALFQAGIVRSLEYLMQDQRRETYGPRLSR